ncbi:unnamed protein product, partial [Ectocarpus sp. 12 AP-2014]
SSSLLLPLLVLGFSTFYGQCATISISPGGTAFQDALDKVNPGDVIELGRGDYWEDIKTTIDGTADMPIIIRGAGGTDDRDNVVLRGDGTSSRIFEVKHDHYIIEDFAVNGDAEDDPDRGAGSDSIKELWRDILIYATGGREPTERDRGYVSGIDGLVIRSMAIANAGGECIRLRDHVTYAEVYCNTITDCGIYDFREEDTDGKNGKGVYIGTSSNQWDDGDNWSDGPDVCQGITVRDNFIRTKGNEGIEVKEGTVDTLIEGNEVYMQYDAESGGIGSRGDRSIIRYNHIKDTDGAGVRLGGHTVDGIGYGANNQVYENTMVNCRASGIKVMITPQGQICSNDIEVPDTDDDANYNYSGGVYYYDPLISCDASSSSALGSTSVSPTPEATTESFAEAMNEESAEPTIEPTTEPTLAATLEAPTAPTPAPTTQRSRQRLRQRSRQRLTQRSSQRLTQRSSQRPRQRLRQRPSQRLKPAVEKQYRLQEISAPEKERVHKHWISWRRRAIYRAYTPLQLPPIFSAYFSRPHDPISNPYVSRNREITKPKLIGLVRFKTESTCSNGLEGIDHRGEICCSLGCGQCGGPGCDASGASNGLGAESCCPPEVHDSGRYCDDTNEAPCII